jgi:hypothetical protein
LQKLQCNGKGFFLVACDECINTAAFGLIFREQSRSGPMDSLSDLFGVHRGGWGGITAAAVVMPTVSIFVLLLSSTRSLVVRGENTVRVARSVKDANDDVDNRRSEPSCLAAAASSKEVVVESDEDCCC